MNTPPRWIEVRVVAPLGWHEVVAEALTRGPCTTVAFGRPSLATDPAPVGTDYVRTFIPLHADSQVLRDELRAAIEGLGALTEAPELENLPLEFRPLAPEDYATSWKKVWKPFRVGRLCVLAPWSTSQPRTSDIVMQLEPGGAFGSGRHATTRTMLRVIGERIRPGQSVLDAGSGSGILGVAAVMLGARSAFGFDVDPNATPYATDLARDNFASDRCRFVTGGFEIARSQHATYDVVLANIYADLIVAQASVLRDLLDVDGWFAFSGCAVHHADEVRATLLVTGFELQEERVCGRWHTFVGRRGTGATISAAVTA